jgi:hypothetical protein
MKKKTAREKETTRGKTKTGPSKRGPVQDLKVRDRDHAIKGGQHGIPPPC